MEARRFARIAEEGKAQLTALMSPLMPPGVLGGEPIFYNAYFGGTEVVVLGFRKPDGEGGTLTKPIAIMVDEAVFDGLRVDDERSRVDGSGQDAPKHVQ